MGSGGTVPPFLTSALDGGEWSASCLRLFTSRTRAPGTHWIGGWVDPRACLYAVEKIEVCRPCWESNPSHPAHNPSLYQLSYQASSVLL
jgi:hypothetical protein